MLGPLFTLSVGGTGRGRAGRAQGSSSAQGSSLATGTAYGNLGNAHHSLGEYGTAIEYHHKHLEIAQAVGDRAGEGKA